MSDDKTNEGTESAENKDAAAENAPEQQEPASSQSGPNFTEAPDPLAGVKKVYVGTIIGIIVLMLLARCGGS
jgi:hypothetical protein